MTKQKNTKRALLASGLALFMCISMFVGSTFAWFTDSVKTGVNTIQSGNLDIVLEYSMDDGATWADAEGKTLNFVAADDRTDILWEPGCKYVLPAIRVRNNGNLALKYSIVINGVDGNAKLLEAIDFTANGGPISTFIGNLNNKNEASAPIVIEGHMKETAGNDYQGLSIEGIGITVIATQHTYESDSYGIEYDKNAWTEVAEAPVPDANGAVAVWTGEQLAGVMQNINGIKTINIMEHIDLGGRAWVPGNFWVGGTIVINGNGHTISNMTANGAGSLGFIGQNRATITINDLTFKNAEVNATGSFAGTIIGYAYGNITLNNVDVVDSKVSTAISNKGIRAGGLLGFVPSDGGTLTLKDCDVSGSEIAGYHNVGAMVGTTMTQKAVTIENCTAKSNTLTYGSLNVGAFAFGAGTSGYTEYVPASGFTAENNTFDFVTYAGSDSEINAAIDAGRKEIVLKSGNYGVIDVTVNRNLTLSAAANADVKIAGIDGQSNNNSTNVTIKGVTIDNSLQTEGWYTGTAQKIKPCVGVWGGNYTFENCTFSVTGASGAETGVMSWWTTNKGVMNFTNCTFNGGNGSARGMQIYGNYDLNVTNCTFNTAKDYSIKYVGAEGCVATFKNNNVNATTNFVQTGSAPYAGANYKLVFEGNTLATGINHVYVDNAEGQTITINGVVKAATNGAIY